MYVLIEDTKVVLLLLFNTLFSVTIQSFFFHLYHQMGYKTGPKNVYTKHSFITTTLTVQNILTSETNRRIEEMKGIGNVYKNVYHKQMIPKLQHLFKCVWEDKIQLNSTSDTCLFMSTLFYKKILCDIRH